MGVVVGIVLFAVGAILRFATRVHSATLNIQTVGDILMIVGVVAFILGALAWAYWDGPGSGGFARQRTTFVDSAPPVHGPNGYARTSYGPTTYDAAGNPVAPVGANPAAPAGPVPPAGTVVEEEEHRVF